MRFSLSSLTIKSTRQMQWFLRALATFPACLISCADESTSREVTAVTCCSRLSPAQETLQDAMEGFVSRQDGSSDPDDSRISRVAPCSGRAWAAAKIGDVNNHPEKPAIDVDKRDWCIQCSLDCFDPHGDIMEYMSPHERDDQRNVHRPSPPISVTDSGCRWVLCI